MQTLQRKLAEIYHDQKIDALKLTFVITQKRYHFRIRDVSSRDGNPPPGALIDDLMVVDEEYPNFYLYSHKVISSFPLLPISPHLTSPHLTSPHLNASHPIPSYPSHLSSFNFDFPYPGARGDRQTDALPRFARGEQTYKRPNRELLLCVDPSTPGLHQIGQHPRACVLRRPCVLPRSTCFRHEVTNMNRKIKVTPFMI